MFRVFRKRHEIKPVQDRTGSIGPSDILAFSTVRNEIDRLPHFLEYYRALGVGHFLFVDNRSDDGTSDYLAAQADVSLWSTEESYRLSRFGVDWLAVLQFKFGHGHWCLTVDADELLVYPNSEQKDLHDLTKHMDATGQKSLGTIMLDMFPKGSLDAEPYKQGGNPLDVIPWFDATGYWTQKHAVYGNEWIQGGVRARAFFQDEPSKAPTLNKFPLVKWDRRYAYVNSTHQILPIRLHDSFDLSRETNVSGALLHTKFLPNIAEKSREELDRKQHFQNSAQYRDYHQALIEHPVLWSKTAEKYRNTHQLVALGLVSKGKWPG